MRVARWQGVPGCLGALGGEWPGRWHALRIACSPACHTAGLGVGRAEERLQEGSIMFQAVVEPPKAPIGCPPCCSCEPDLQRFRCGSDE